MELVEQKFRDTTKSNKKFIKHLTKFVNSLLCSDRILEAHFYFKKLIELSPNHIKTVVLGYKLSIKTFDSKGVSYYDKKLYILKKNEEELLLLRLQYYYSVNNKALAEDCALLLLSKQHLEPETLQTISDFSREHQSYNLISNIGKYLSLNKMIFHPSIEKQFKKYVISQLIKLMKKVKG